MLQPIANPSDLECRLWLPMVVFFVLLAFDRPIFADEFASRRESVSVTLDNFVRAQSDLIFRSKEQLGAFGTLVHDRKGIDIEQQAVARNNRDLLYSYGVFDLTTSLFISKPDTGNRFQSMQVINQDHFTKLVAYEPGDYVLTREMVGTRYAQLVFRTLCNPDDPRDLAAVHRLQDQIDVKQAAIGKLELPDWDQAGLVRLQRAILALTPFVAGTKGMFGDEHEVDPIARLVGAAGGWGGSRPKDAIYFNFYPPMNDGKKPHVLSLRNIPVDGFWSISVYNRDGFFEKNPQGAYSLNNISAKPDRDGSYTIHFGGSPRAENYLAIMPHWSYTVRLYRPRREVLDGTWRFPAASPAK